MVFAHPEQTLEGTGIGSVLLVLLSRTLSKPLEHRVEGEREERDHRRHLAADQSARVHLIVLFLLPFGFGASMSGTRSSSPSCTGLARGMERPSALAQVSHRPPTCGLELPESTSLPRRLPPTQAR